MFSGLKEVIGRKLKVRSEDGKKNEEDEAGGSFADGSSLAVSLSHCEILGEKMKMARHVGCQGLKKKEEGRKNE